MIGRTLAHYRIESLIGSGGMGEVYLAHDTRLDRRVALKVLPPHLATDPDHRRRFEREARSIAALSHPNIVTIHSVEEANGTHFLTMELIAGEKLSDLIPEHGMPLERWLATSATLTGAVAAAHRAGVTHRDLKPDNVMVDREGRLKVLDFGLARVTATNPPGADPLTEELTQEGRIVGTVAYMSPEQVDGRPADSRSDVFSLGVVLYEIASGKRPFQGRSSFSILSAILRDSPPDLGSLSPGLPRPVTRLVERCLAKDPAARFQSAGELHAELEALRRKLEAGDLRPRRRRIALLLATAAVTIVLAVTAVLLGRRSETTGGPAESSARPSIAVLPFANLSGDPDNEYFSDGITEEITSKLARIQGLEVAARTAAARFEGSDAGPQAIGRQLGVGHLLDGSVRKSGNQVRITAQLVSCETGFQLWAEEFQGSLDDVFRVQEETALEIARALDLRLSPGERQAVQRRATSNPQAYDAYLRGRALVEYFAIPDKLDTARSHFERALELDPEFPLALAGLSRVEAQYHRNLDPSPQRLERAEALARRALELDPQLAEAHLAMGQVEANRYDYARAAELFRTAIRLEPTNSYAWDLLSWALAYRQPPDPVEAEEAARRAIGLQASLIGAHYHLGRALLLQGRHDEAIAAFEHTRTLDPEFETADFGLAQAFLARGEPARALEALARLGALRDSPVVPVTEASAHAALGDRGKAVAALDRAFSLGYRDLATLGADPHLASLEDDPAFAELLRRHGISGGS